MYDRMESVRYVSRNPLIRISKPSQALLGSSAGAACVRPYPALVSTESYLLVIKRNT